MAAMVNLEFVATQVAPTLLLVFLIVLVIGLFFPSSRKVVLTKAWPAFIGGLFVAFIVPLATQIYWRQQKDFEICVQDRLKRHELVGSTARTYSTLFKIHTRLHQIAREWAQEEKKIRSSATGNQPAPPTLNIQAAHLTALDSLRSDLVKERIRLEAQLGADSALISQYLPAAAKKYYEVGTFYDRRTSEVSTFLPTPADPLVRGANDLISLMAEEARKSDCR